jgi:hypothetical protein
MAPFRNPPVPKAKYPVNLAACRQNFSGPRRYPSETTCASNCFHETTARASVLSSPKKRPNFHQYRGLIWLEPIAKLPFAGICHSERREESRIFNNLRSFTSFRMTIKTGFAIASNINRWRLRGAGPGPPRLEGRTRAGCGSISPLARLWRCGRRSPYRCGASTRTPAATRARSRLS